MSFFMSCLGKMPAGNFGKVVKSAIQNGGDELVGKILHSRTTLQASDLSGQTFNSVLADLRQSGLGNIKIVPTRNGGHVVHVPNIQRTGVSGLFPGGVMTPNGGKITNVSFKFNAAGDCVQLTGVQKTANGVAGSTIRTSQGIEELAKAGVHNPTEYIQAASIGKQRYVNRTFSPFGDKPVPVKEAQVASTSAAKTVNSIENPYNEVFERMSSIKPQEAQRIVGAHSAIHDAELAAKSAQNSEIYKLRMAEERAEKRLLYSIDNIQESLKDINPELGEKVGAKILQIAEKDPVKAQKFADRLIERYRGTDLERFRAKTSSLDLDDNTFKLPDIDDYYPRTDNLFKDPLANPWDDILGC